MKLPSMKYTDNITKSQQIKFGGLNYSKGAGDGELWDMRNLTSDHYPLLATRALRWKTGHIDSPEGLFSWKKLCWVGETGFYYDGEHMIEVSEGEKTFASIGPYIVIFPDKYYYNVDTGEMGPLEECVRERELCFTDGERDGLIYKNSCIIGECDYESCFRPGDTVTIEGCTNEPTNNKTVTIRAIKGNRLYFDENMFIIPDAVDEFYEGGELYIKRTVPDLKFICENENRLWGCTEDRIFACSLGDPFNWNSRDGVETDGYDVDTGSAGVFTGCISYQGYPTFFKEDHIYKVYGSLPSNFEVIGSTALGLAEGSSRSLAVANGILFYLGRNGVMAYTGGVPQPVGTAFGLKRFKNAAAGSDGLKYYISMQDETGAWGLYVYDTLKGLWHKEDDCRVIQFAWHDDNLHMLTAEGDLYITGNAQELPENAEQEAGLEWLAEFTDFTEEDPNKKGVSKLQVRVELEAGATVQAWLMFDSDGTWLPAGKAMGENTKRSYYLPIVPRRCDHYRLKLTGTGACRIYSLTRETYSGSELKSKEGRN